MGIRLFIVSALLGAALLLFSTTVHAEQKVVVGEYEIHYIVIPTTFLRPEVADQYELPRGKNRALVNVSVLDGDGAVKAGVSGSSRNLLEQRQVLKFTEVDEGNAVYYLALITHADEENHRISIQVELPDGKTEEINFVQKMYWEP